MSDEVLGTVLPILIYWIYSGLYVVLGKYDKYRLHTREDEDVKNLVSKSEVVKGVLFQQLVQACVATLLFTVITLLFFVLLMIMSCFCVMTAFLCCF